MKEMDKAKLRKWISALAGLVLLVIGFVVLNFPSSIEETYHISARSFESSGYYGVYLGLIILSKTIALLGAIACWVQGAKQIWNTIR